MSTLFGLWAAVTDTGNAPAIAPTTVAGALVVYVICPLIVLGLTAAGRWAILHGKRLDAFEVKQAAMLQEIAPPNGIPLREVIAQQRVDLATLRGEIAALSEWLSNRGDDPRMSRPPRP